MNYILDIGRHFCIEYFILANIQHMDNDYLLIKCLSPILIDRKIKRFWENLRIKASLKAYLVGLKHSLDLPIIGWKY